MTVSIRDLLSLPGMGMKVVAGDGGLDRPIRWAHISELQDPTPWLSGGELLLTTGMDLKGSAALQRAYIRRLVKAGVAGLGFGMGFGFEEVPQPMRRAAEAESFPVLEVPYPVPFIAITEAVSSRLAEDRLRDAQMSVEVHERLASLVAEGSGPADVLDEVVSLAGGWTILFDLTGEVLAHSETSGAPVPSTVWRSLPRGLADRGGPASSALTGPSGSRVALAVTAGKRAEAVLVFGKESRIGQRDRMVVHHAVTVLGLLLASRRAVIEVERRIAGDMLSDAFSGRVEPDALERRLELLGFPPGAPMTVLVLESPWSGDAQALDDLAGAVDSALARRTRAARTAVVAGRIAALVSEVDTEKLAQRLLREVTAAAGELGLPVGDSGDLRIGVGQPAGSSGLRHSYLSAVFALRAAPRAQHVATPRDLGSYALLLGSQQQPVLETFVSSVLGPLIDRDRQRSSELVASVQAFVEASGRWEQGAEQLGVHRHTLRYRVRQAEELLGRDLSSAEDRLEIWLALKALEILDQ